MTLTPAEIEFLAVLVHELTVSPFGGPATKAVLKLGVRPSQLTGLCKRYVDQQNDKAFPRVIRPPQKQRYPGAPPTRFSTATWKPDATTNERTHETTLHRKRDPLPDYLGLRRQPRPADRSSSYAATEARGRLPITRAPVCSLALQSNKDQMELINTPTGEGAPTWPCKETRPSIRRKCR